MIPCSILSLRGNINNNLRSFQISKIQKIRKPKFKFGETYKIFQQRRDETNVIQNFNKKPDKGCWGKTR